MREAFSMKGLSDMVLGAGDGRKAFTQRARSELSFAK